MIFKLSDRGNLVDGAIPIPSFRKAKMNNNAFKDLVRSYGQSNSGNSSKEIARKAVEEEFRKKKRKRSGDADYSSDEGEGNHRSSHKKIGKRQHQQERKADDDDDAEAIQKDLSSRYRDRAKERREGKVANDNADETSNAGGGASSNFLIVPHNIKGLDLALVRKERVALQSRSGGGNRKSTTTANMGAMDQEDVDAGSTSKIRDKMPTLDQANQILHEFLSGRNDKGTSDNNYDDCGSTTTLSNEIAEYLSEIVSWKTLDVSTWDGESATGAATRNSLQHTKFSLAIDGHPSDSTRAWEIPRQYTLSRAGYASGGAASSPALLPNDLMKKIDRVFRHKNFIREEMMKRPTLTSNQSRTIVNDRKERQSEADKNASTGVDDDESDEDMFGGLDD